jgi:cellulose synthase/poly-beta-1,6-N-acetylglucosamine synthase-like glycosyltransferase
MRFTDFYFLTVALVSVLILYIYGVFWSSRRHMSKPRDPENLNLFFVFVVPCLNEAPVVGACVSRLLAFPAANSAILVVDDGSDDQTSAIVRPYLGERVWLLRRELPNARQGKGQALNAAFQHLLIDERVTRHEVDHVILVVVDSDGRLEQNALSEVGPYFSDREVGAVQIGVRMYNAADNLLARMQDFEFVTFTELFQRARSRVGTAGLGGNGQFTRLAALLDLGELPWTDCLTEDLDLGLRIICAGWQSHFCSTTWVSQQAVTSLRKLVRQRARWFQGHLQCWKRIREFGSIDAPRRGVAGLIHHLLSPVLVLAISLPVFVFFGSTIVLAVADPSRLARVMTAHRDFAPIAWYLLSFSVALPFSIAYHEREPSASWLRTICYAHVFVVYNYMWFLSGWTAVWRTVAGRSAWTKTVHSIELAGEPTTPSTGNLS